MKNIAVFSTILAIIGLAILFVINPRVIVNQRSNPVVSESRLKDFPIENLLTYTEKLTELKKETVLPTNLNTSRVIEYGDNVRVHYRGWLATNGKIFDESFKRGDTGFQFTVGSGVITGWSEGVVNSKVGDVIRLSIPSEKAYGAQSPSADIPANSDMVFYVEILEILN